MGFKVVTWNINGLRSFGGMQAWRSIFTALEADVVCMQETKINRSAVEEWMAFVPDFTSYFAFPRGQLQTSGFNGVATFCRESAGVRPSHAEVTLFLDAGEIFTKSLSAFEFDTLDEEHQFATRWPDVYAQQSQIGLPLSQLGVHMWKIVDSEGRCVITKHTFTIDEDDSPKSLFIFNVYCPRKDDARPERQHFQLRFYQVLEKRALQLLKESSENFVIILGDYNTTHQSIDVYDDDQWCYKDSCSRKWLSELLSKKQDDSSDQFLFFDAFRHLNPNEEKSFTCWNVKLDCRKTNFGSRLDYIVIDHKLVPHLTKCTPLSDFLGSDHCPVVAEFDDRLHFTPSDEYSEHCTKMWPEFGLAKQTLIKSFCVSREEAEKARLLKAAQTKRHSSPDGQQTEYPATSGLSNNNNKKVKKNPSTSKPAGQTSVRNYFTSFKLSAKEADQPEAPKGADLSPKKSVLTEISQASSSTASSSGEKSPQPDKQPSLAGKWAAIFSQAPPPLCAGHNLPCVRRKVRKEGPTQGKEFFACQKSSVGPKDHPDSRCNFFQWVNSASKNTKPGGKQVLSSPLKVPEDINDLWREE